MLFKKTCFFRADLEMMHDVDMQCLKPVSVALNQSCPLVQGLFQPISVTWPSPKHHGRSSGTSEASVKVCVARIPVWMFCSHALSRPHPSDTKR